MRLTKISFAGALALMVAACVGPTPYQPLAPERGGYSEQRLSENQYRVVFTGNARTAPEQVERLLLRRAAELTLKAGYDWFRPTNRVVEGRIRTIQTSRGPVRVSEGPGYSKWDNYGAFFHAPSVRSLLKPIWRRINPPSGEAVEASAEIVLGRAPIPQIEGAVDARRLLESLGK
jgi:hypothetical protein